MVVLVLFLCCFNTCVCIFWGSSCIKIIWPFAFYLSFQHKLKSSQRDKVRQFIAFTQTTEKAGIQCLSCHDWKLDVAVDNFFQNPDKYTESVRPTVDRKRIEALWQRYKGMLCVNHKLVLPHPLSKIRLIQSIFIELILF